MTAPDRLEHRRHRQRRRRRPGGRPARSRCVRRASVPGGGRGHGAELARGHARRAGGRPSCSTRSSPRWPTTCRRASSRPACSAAPSRCELVARWVDRLRAAIAGRAGRRPGARAPAPARRSPMRRRSRPTASSCCRARRSSRRTGARPQLLAGRRAADDVPGIGARAAATRRARRSASPAATAATSTAARSTGSPATTPAAGSRCRASRRAQPRHRLHVREQCRRGAGARLRRRRRAWCWRRWRPRTRCATAARPARGAGPVHRAARLRDATLRCCRCCRSARAPRCPASAPTRRGARLGLYAIVDSAERVRAGAGGRRAHACSCASRAAPARAALRDADRSAASTPAAKPAPSCSSTTIGSSRSNCGASGVHLGQEDLQALGDDGRARRCATAACALGISSHSLWELCRARSLAPRLHRLRPGVADAPPRRCRGGRRACDNLAWWCAMAGAPVVAIGGILSAAAGRRRRHAAAPTACASSACWATTRRATVPALREALNAGRWATPVVAPTLPHPSLDGDVARQAARALPAPSVNWTAAIHAPGCCAPT